MILGTVIYYPCKDPLVGRVAPVPVRIDRPVEKKRQREAESRGNIRPIPQVSFDLPLLLFISSSYFFSSTPAPFLYTPISAFIFFVYLHHVTRRSMEHRRGSSCHFLLYVLFCLPLHPRLTQWTRILYSLLTLYLQHSCLDCYLLSYREHRRLFSPRCLEDRHRCMHQLYSR
jgi:hypothetical protein